VLRQHPPQAEGHCRWQDARAPTDAAPPAPDYRRSQNAPAVTAEGGTACAP
jgi:hypothetical protein